MRRRRETDDLLNLHSTNISSVYPASRKPEKLGTANTKYKQSSLQDHIILEIIYSPMFGVADECQGAAQRANMTYFLWTSNPVHDLSLEDGKQLNQQSFIQETLAHGEKFGGVKLNMEAFFLIFSILLYFFPPILIIYPYAQYFVPFRDNICLKTYTVKHEFGVKQSHFVFTPRTSADWVFSSKGGALLTIYLCL